jgi:hypothetical protein
VANNGAGGAHFFSYYKKAYGADLIDAITPGSPTYSQFIAFQFNFLGWTIVTGSTVLTAAATAAVVLAPVEGIDYSFNFLKSGATFTYSFVHGTTATENPILQEFIGRPNEPGTLGDGHFEDLFTRDLTSGKITGYNATTLANGGTLLTYANV